MADIYDPNRGYVPPLDPRGGVYDPLRGMMPSSPQQAWWEQLLAQLDPRNIGGQDSYDRERQRIRQAQAEAAIRRGDTSIPADPIVPPPMATGEQGYVAPIPARGSLVGPITPTTPTGAAAVVPPPWASGASDLPPVSAAPAAGGVLPPLDRDRGLPPLTTPNSMIATPAPSMLGGNNYTASGAGMSGTEEQDALRRAGSAASGSSGGGLPGALSGLGGPMPLNRSAAEALYEDESGLALRQGFKDAGIDSFTNSYAQRAIKRYAPIMGDLMDFFAIASGINPGDTATMATWVPAFIKGFMSGEIDPDKMVRRAIDLAEQSPILKTFLVEQIGVERLLNIQGRTSGYGPRVEAARQSVIKERLARQQMDTLQNPIKDQEDAWLQIVRGGGR